MGNLYQFSIPLAANPFALTPSSVWTTLPGERSNYIPISSLEQGLNVWHYEDRKGDERKIHRYQKVSVGGRIIYWGLQHEDLKSVTPILKGYVNRALQYGRRWVINTSGVEGWSVWEWGTLRAFVEILDEWISEVERDIVDIGYMPKAYTRDRVLVSTSPAIVKAQALLTELRAARGALKAFEETILTILNGDIALVNIRALHASYWFQGALDEAQRRERDLVGLGEELLDNDRVQGVLDAAEDLDLKLKEHVKDLLTDTLKPVYDSVKAQVQALVENALSAIGVQVASAGGHLTSALPFLATIAEGFAKLIDFLLTEDKPWSLKEWKRFDKGYGRVHLDEYSTLMYRAMEAHRARTRNIVEFGTVTWDPGKLENKGFLAFTNNITLLKSNEELPELLRADEEPNTLVKAAVVGGSIGLIWLLLS